MSDESDWDVDKYKSPSESEEQWNLRRNFMTRWKGEIPEDRLVCLARVFTNVEFLGCRYPGPVMTQIAHLSKEVAADFRERRKNKLKRTFVSASDVAEEKAKRSKRPSVTEPLKFVSSESLCSFGCPRENFHSSKTPTLTSDSHNQSNNFQKRPIHNRKINLRSQYGNLILRDSTHENFISKINNSCQASKVQFSWEMEKRGEEWKCSCVINNVLVHSSIAETQKLAKEKTALESWSILQKQCYTIVQLQSHISKNDKKISSRELEDENSLKVGLNSKVESPIASRMMKLMGWKGGALGVSGDGISEPVAPNLKQIHRKGLGSSGDSEKEFTTAMNKVLAEFKSSHADYDLVFANDFTKDERAKMHQLALRQGLKSKSFGQDSERYLVIFKQRTSEQLIHSLIESGGSNEKYKLIYPGVLKD